MSSSFGTTTPVSTSIPNGQLQHALLPGNLSTLAVPAANVTTGPLNTMVPTENNPAEAILPSATKTEKFLLTAADQEPGSRDERLNRVIRSKYEAGLLKPYNYVIGYARLSRWMDRKYVSLDFIVVLHSDFDLSVSQESKQQILQPLSVLRPKFRVSHNQRPKV